MDADNRFKKELDLAAQDEPQIIAEFRIHDDPRQRFLEEYHNCCLCGTEMIFTHNTDFVEGVVLMRVWPRGTGCRGGSCIWRFAGGGASRRRVPYAPRGAGMLLRVTSLFVGCCVSSIKKVRCPSDENLF